MTFAVQSTVFLAFLALTTNAEKDSTINDGSCPPYVLEAKHTKCSSHKNEHRLFREEKERGFDTVEKCYKKCRDTEGCKYFTFGSDGVKEGQNWEGLCIGCNKHAEQVSHDGFLHYIMNKDCDVPVSDAPSVFPSAYEKGDPHFMTWSGETYDFHGVCDLVLVRVATFGEGIGMDIHIRTKKMKMWSFVASAAVRIGQEIFEVTGGGKAKYLINGVEEKSESNEDGVSLVSTISGFLIHRIRESGKGDKFAINLGDDEKVVISTWHSYVSVSFENARNETFKGTVGLLGSFSGGLKLARDGTTIITELNEYGQEWQVRASEPQLFHTIEGPQYPLECQIPSTIEMRRHLGESKLTMNEAKKACVDVNEAEMNLCIFDVLATNDKFAAGAY